MKTKEVNEIIKDLYNIDPSLKEYEDKIRDIVFEIYYQKPEIEINDAFKNELKEKIINRIYELKRESVKNTSNTKENNQSKLILTMKRINYILSGAVVTACLFGVFIYVSNNKNYKNTSGIANNLNTVDFSLNIKNTGNNFGEIFSQNSVNSNENTKSSAASAGVKLAPSSLGIGGEGVSSTIMDSKMIAPNSNYVPTIYKYVYDGDKTFLDNLNDTDFPVLKRVKDSTVPFNNTNIINTNIIDISKFNNLKINNISIDEDKDRGYSLYMSLIDGTLSISKNWAKWPQLDYNTQLTINDVASNNELISIASDFAKDYNINLENYSAPEIQTDYAVLYAKTTDKSSFYIPASTSVIYPLTINGKEVYEQYGSKYGIIMSINFKEKKVEYVNNIQTLKFESASYDLNKNVDDILKVAENTDNYYAPDSTSNYKTVEIKLTDPKLAYAKIYNYDNATGINNEFLVPAVVFKTNDSTDETQTYYRNYIVVPLTKEYIDGELNRIKDLENMPKIEPTTSTGSVGEVKTMELRVTE